MGIWSLLAATFSDWYDDRAQRMGAALAYYTVFALAPGVVLIVAIAGLGFGPETAQQQFVEQIGYLLGAEGARAIEAMIVSARQQAVGTTAAALAAGTLLFGLWGVFGELQDSLNTIWGVAPKPGRGFLQMVKDRFLSFAMVTGIGFLLLVSLAVSAWLAAAGKFFSYLLPAPEMVLKGWTSACRSRSSRCSSRSRSSCCPTWRSAWRDVWVGAGVTSVLFVAGKSLIGLYLGKSSIGSVYGAAGSLVVILVWVYYSSQIVIFGAEFTKVWARRRGAAPSSTHRRAPHQGSQARAGDGTPRRRLRIGGTSLAHHWRGRGAHDGIPGHSDRRPHATRHGHDGLQHHQRLHRRHRQWRRHAGEGSALAKETKDPKESNAGLAKGELMGTGVGAAAGALYDVKKRR